MIKINKIHHGDVLDILPKIPDDCIQLIITSPPYNVKMDYNTTDDDMPEEDYIIFTRNWIGECYRILVDGGRLAINVGNTGRKPYKYLNNIISSACLDLKMLARQEFIWYKGHAVAAGKTSWGSYCDAPNPITRDCHEYIEVFSKNDYKLNCDGFSSADITKSEFALCSFSVWEIKPSKKIPWHPAPFPEEIPYRLIKFYTRPGMLVLDPFAGSGTTAIVAQQLNRDWIGIEKNKEYIDRFKIRLKSGLQRSKMFDKVERQVKKNNQRRLF